MRIAPAVLAAAVVFACSAAQAARPEIERPVGTPQARGAAHTVRALPEACAWLQGTFTGDAAAPYRVVPVRTSPTCQARARLVSPDKAKPTSGAGWILNDLVRIPSKECPTRIAVVEVWRKPGQAQPPKLDAQGRSRIYLQESKAKVAAGDIAAITQFTATVRVEGAVCG
ncbi:hypothetical protein [Lysobacter humi (ex Lee et al. 2017)]